MDLFAPHNPPSPLSLFPYRGSATWSRATLGNAPTQWMVNDYYLPGHPSAKLTETSLKFYDSYAIGGPGLGGYGEGAHAEADVDRVHDVVEGVDEHAHGGGHAKLDEEGEDRVPPEEIGLVFLGIAHWDPVAVGVRPGGGRAGRCGNHTVFRGKLQGAARCGLRPRPWRVRLAP